MRERQTDRAERIDEADDGAATSSASSSSSAAGASLGGGASLADAAGDSAAAAAPTFEPLRKIHIAAEKLRGAHPCKLLIDDLEQNGTR